MAKEKNKYNFAGLHINDIMGQPLISVAKAQDRMAKEQIRSILDSCFHFDGNVYTPVLLKMTVSRSVVVSDSTDVAYGKLKHVSSVFNLPIITIFPINSLGIDNVNIAFNLEITSQYESDLEEDNLFVNAKTKDIVSIAKISNLKQRETSNSANIPSNVSEMDPSIQVSVNAGKLPLTRGLLEIIDIYSNTVCIDDQK